MIIFVSDAVPAVVSLKSGDLNIAELRRKNYCGLPVHGYVEDFQLANGKTVKVTGHRGISAAHIQASIDLLIESPRPFKKLITDVVKFDDASSISSAVAWSLGRGTGDRSMKTVIELNGGAI